MTIYNSEKTLVWIFVLLLVPAMVWAATDPDIDPASPLPIAATAEGIELEVICAKAFLQKSSDGLPYVRVDLEIVNTGAESIHSSAWQVKVGGVSADLVAAGTLKPGEQRGFSQLLMGSQVSALAGGAPAVNVVVTQLTAELSCDIVSRISTEAACRQWAALTQNLCWGQCITSGASGGQVSCLRQTYTDSSGLKCEFWAAVCTCEGRLTLNEGLSDELFDPTDPLLGDIVVNPPQVESRQLRP